MISLISASSQIHLLSRVSSSSASLWQDSRLLSVQQKTADRLDEAVLMRTHGDDPESRALVRGKLMENQGTWREEAIKGIAEKIADNNGLMENIQKEIQEEIEASKRETDETDKATEKDGTEDAAENDQSPATKTATASKTTSPHIDILV